MISSNRVLPGLLDLDIRERAQDDIFNIIEYGVAAHGKEATRAYVDAIAARIEWLRTNARLGPVHSELRGGIRSFRQSRHRIYYVANPQRMSIIRILHVSMDVLHLLD